MPIFVADLAFERKLLIVNLLKVRPSIQGEVDGLREAFFQIYLHTNVGASLKTIFRFHSVNVLTQRVTNGPKSSIIPTMEREERKVDPDRNNRKNSILCIKIGGPSIKLHIPRVPMKYGPLLKIKPQYILS
jgi:hypothetical protein